jgi:capsule polysaccharide export protein KpsC/LpsZ
MEKFEIKRSETEAKVAELLENISIESELVNRANYNIRLMLNEIEKLKTNQKHYDLFIQQQKETEILSVDQIAEALEETV